MLRTKKNRTKETAFNAFEDYKTFSALNSFFSSKFAKNRDKQMKDLRNFVNKWDSKKNIVFVTHYVVILEALNSFAILATHLIRFSNEIIYFGSTNIGLYKLPKNWTTGSSIMPNKRNPDTIEITRAKMARVIACASEGLSIVGAVVPSYGSDLHELKRTFLRSFEELESSIEIMICFISELKINETIASEMLEKGHILATELANKLSAESSGEFRKSYLKIKNMVDQAEDQGIQIHELDSWPSDLNFKSSVASRKQLGGTSKEQVLNQIVSLEES